jgi:hypothetical protein
VPLAEQLVDAILTAPPEVPTSEEAGVSKRGTKLTLKKLEAHRFAGLHKFVTPERPPDNFILEFSSSVHLFEGANGSGKTSLANAIIWALTGELLRPQREPEKGTEEFQCRIDLEQSANSSASIHKICQVTPLPDPSHHVPEKGWVHADTWVELTFADETGRLLTPIRRSVSRTPQGRLFETPPNLGKLGVDPISFRIGTVMPGLLPLIRVGSESELGKAVAQLTGLSSLVDLSENVRRARTRIDKEFVKQKTQAIESADESYGRTRTDLIEEIEAHPSIRPAQAVPPPSTDASIEAAIEGISAHFLSLYTTSVSAAQNVLSDTFDPGNGKLRADLENSIGAALSEVRQLRLDSLARLKSLRMLTPEELSAAKQKITTLVSDAATLHALSLDPAREARLRLYALVALWTQEHPESKGSEDVCVVCESSLDGVMDRVTHASVKGHIQQAKSNAALVSQTIKRWSEVALGELQRSLPVGLRGELQFEGPQHPCDLIRAALVEELFETGPFKGVLSGLREATAEAFDRFSPQRPSLASPTPIHLPAECAVLEAALVKLDRAIRFAEWRQSQDAFCGKLFGEVVGRVSERHDDGQPPSLASKLSGLDTTVKSVAPLTKALTFCERLKADLKKRRAAEKRLADYAVASSALEKLLPLGDFADLQVARLRQELRAQASKWRDSVYQAGFPAAAHELLDTRTSRRGHLELIVGSGGISAPAHHVTNASALRAGLVGFYLAFWEYVLKERGGLRLIILDDPEELFDEVNRERLGDTLPKLAAVGAQIVVTTHDRRFAGYVARLGNECKVEHRSVHPATALQPAVRTPLSAADIEKKRKIFDADRNSEEAAQDYAGACRVHIETMLSDLFDDPAYSSWVNATPAPTFGNYVDRLRGLARTSPNGVFSATVFSNFVNHAAVASTSATGKLLNKPHHHDRRWITPAEVAACSNELNELVNLADRMHEERRMWRRKDRETTESAAVSVTALESLQSLSAPDLKILVCPDLAAFTGRAPEGESQASLEILDPVVLASKALFYLRRDNFGFAAPQGSVAIVKADALPAGDRSLVIARHGGEVYARRLLRPEQPGLIGLVAETPDPRRSPRTKFLRESDVALHEVVGVLFQTGISLKQGREEAVAVDDPLLLKGIEVAHRVREDSAIPLALPRQIALGGKVIALDSFGQNEGNLVALTLDDGSSVFKRIGASLPGDLGHLREFETIGGLGSSKILSVGKPHAGFSTVLYARLIVGVLYND